MKSGGTLLNQRFLPSLLKREEDISKLASLIRSYFALGGHHIQFNIVDTETLYAAQKCPEDYRDLLVRVAGYSEPLFTWSSLPNDLITADGPCVSAPCEGEVPSEIAFSARRPFGVAPITLPK